MIVIRMNATRVEEIAFTGDSVIEREVESAVWRAIAPLVNQLDRKLRRLSDQVVAGLRAEDAAAGLKLGEGDGR
jgi:hypothetical protein